MRLYAVDPEQLNVIFGCGDADLTDDLDAWIGEALTPEALETLRPLVHKLVDGEPVQSAAPDDLLGAVELLVHHIGDDLEMEPFVDRDAAWLDRLDAALPEVGLRLASLTAWSPVLPVTIPGFGGWSAEQIDRAARVWPKRRKKAEDPEIEAAIEQLHEWLLDAAQNGDCIVAFP